MLRKRSAPATALGVAVVLVLALSMTACGGGTSQVTPDPNGPAMVTSSVSYSPSVLPCKADLTWVYSPFP